MIKKSLYVAAVLLCQLLSLPLNATEEMSQKDLIRLAAFKKMIEGLNEDTPKSIDNTSMLLKAAFEDGRVMYKYQVKPDYFYQFDTADAEKEIPPIFCFQKQAEQQQALKPLKDAIYARLMAENR